MKETKNNVLVLMLMGVTILLIIAVGGLFFKVNQLQQAILNPQSAAPSGGLQPGQVAPPFTLVDTAGQKVSLTDFSGQTTLLVFASTRCQACQRMFPSLQEFSKQRDNVQVVMLLDGQAEELEQFGFTFPVLKLDEKVVQDYQVPGTPFFYVINTKGIITNAAFANTLEQLIALVTGSK